ncbi:MAG TPA: hypothetical protein DIS88_03355 [Prevotella sp.]|nr:hypothetical protein [Prevotella sp.]
MTTEEFQQEATSLRPKMVAIAKRYLNDRDEAEDTAQDAMLMLWQMRDQLHAPITSLAHVLTRNLTLDKIRKRKPVSTLTTDIAEETSDNAEQESICRMMALIDNLPDSQRLLMRLRHMEGMEYSDMAKLTGLSETAIRKAISRARMTIRKQYLSNWEKENNR